MNTLNEQILAFVQAANELSLKYWQGNNYTHSPAPTHRADFISDKWVRVVTVDNGRDSSVYAFICLKDGETKGLGKLKAGDIHKAATFKAPAKHARGNVFDANFANCLTPFGPVYLKGM